MLQVGDFCRCKVAMEQQSAIWRNKVALKMQFQFAHFILWYWRKKCVVFGVAPQALTQNCSNGAAKWWRSKLARMRQWRSIKAMAEQTCKLALNTQLQFIFSSGFLERFERAPKRAE